MKIASESSQILRMREQIKSEIDRQDQEATPRALQNAARTMLQQLGQRLEEGATNKRPFFDGNKHPSPASEKVESLRQILQNQTPSS
ncbi:hypothetical protein BN1013_01474 [Candidatus Rubidus massiliensis]|nr:MAG: hypothetical protein BGO10_04755 [Chlamydia sp. 32-24]CDZ80946.1 hypothetical protein BN1013_01474 [Candidatus Rubidus massiliensis]